MSLIRIIIGIALVTVLAFGDNGVNAPKPVTTTAEPDSCVYYEIKISEQLRITDSLLTIKYITK